MTLRQIEKIWDAPMANSRKSRIRFAMWDALRLAETTVVSKKAKAQIRKLIEDDEGQFDRDGHEFVKGSS